MKKTILSSLFILMFGGYVLYKHSTDTAITIDEKRNLLTFASTTASVSSISYRDGRYTGKLADAYYGNVQVGVVVTGGKLVEVTFLKYPDQQQNSTRLNKDAIPRLNQEAIAEQSANVDSVTGASLTSAAFIESLSAALAQAKS